MSHLSAEEREEMIFQSRIISNTSDNSGYIPVFRLRMLFPKHWGTWLFLGFLRLMVYLPRNFAAIVGAGLGDLYRLADSKRRHVVNVNLGLCYPDMAADRKEHLVRQHYRVYGQTFVDMALIWWASEHFLKRHVRFQGLQYYDDERNRGNSVILLTGHFIAIDIGGPLISRHHKQIGLIKPLYNEVMDWALGRGRIRFGSRMLLRDRGMRQVVQSIKEGYGFSYVPDEDFGPEKSVFVPFLGTQAPTITAVSKLARMTKATVLPCFVWRLPGSAGYQIDMRAPLKNFPSGDDVADAARVRKVLADAVNERPEQYMWTFKFFKTRPDGGPAPYEPGAEKR
jgi:lipid A biosynthesis lauroyl/palmitoleoyl acyltransferase